MPDPEITPQDQDLQLAFPAIGSDEPLEDDAGEDRFLGEFKTKEEAESGIQAQNDRIKDLEAAAEESKGREETLQRNVTALAGVREAPAGDTAKSLLEGLPSPVEDPSGFTRGLEGALENISSRSAQVESNLAAGQREQKLNQIWADFKTNNPELADHEGLLNGIVHAESRKLSADPDRRIDSILADPEAFTVKIAEAGKAELAKIRGNGGEANRTAGIPGGGRASVTTPQNDGPPVKSLVEQVKAIQKETGLY